MKTPEEREAQWERILACAALEEQLELSFPEEGQLGL